MTFDEYRKLEGINASAIKAGRTSMKHMREYMVNGMDDDTACKSTGRQVHCAILEPERFGRDNRVYDGIRRGKEWDAFKASAPDPELIMKPDEYREVSAIANAVWANESAARLLRGATTEVVIAWSGDYGAAKARLDAINGNEIIDVKTTSKIGQFARQFINLGYDIQFGWYDEGAAGIGLVDMTSAVIVAETQAPFDVAVYRVPRLAIEVGRKRAKEIASLYRACESIGKWPGVADGMQELPLPEWYGADMVSQAFVELAASEL